jgi:hypothetical protein
VALVGLMALAHPHQYSRFTPNLSALFTAITLNAVLKQKGEILEHLRDSVVSGQWSVVSSQWSSTVRGEAGNVLPVEVPVTGAGVL